MWREGGLGGEAGRCSPGWVVPDGVQGVKGLALNSYHLQIGPAPVFDMAISGFPNGRMLVVYRSCFPFAGTAITSSMCSTDVNPADQDRYY